jgi:hypothetical protein
MRWVSDIHSADREEVSVLAIVETVAAVSLSLAVYIHTGRVYHIAIAACLAPFLLLRTRRSIRRGLWLGSRFSHRIEMYASSIFGVVLLPFVFPIEILVIKFRATLRSLFCFPRETIRAIPGNWKKIALCTDFGAVPEILPGTETMPFKGEIVGKFGGIFFDRKFWQEFLTTPLYLNIPTIIVHLSALIISFSYRWSLKSTALIWSPLLWYMRPIYPAADLEYRLAQILQLAMSKVSLWYSAFFVCLFLAKVYILAYAGKYMAVIDRILGWPLLRSLFEPAGIPLWQLVAVLNATSAILIFFVADYLQHALKHGRQLPVQAIIGTDRIVSNFRNTATCYTLLCTLYVSVQETGVSLPPIGLKLFPWTV